MRGIEELREVIQRRGIPRHARRAGVIEARRQLIERRLLPRRGMPPRMRIVEKKVGDEKRRTLRPTERQLLERPPPDEHPPRRGLDEGEVAMRHEDRFHHKGTKDTKKSSLCPLCLCGSTPFSNCVAMSLLLCVACPPPTTPAPIRRASSRCSDRSPAATTARTRSCPQACTISGGAPQCGGRARNPATPSSIARPAP